MCVENNNTNLSTNKLVDITETPAIILLFSFGILSVSSRVSLGQKKLYIARNWFNIP